MRTIEAQSGQSLADLDIAQLREQVLEHRVLVLRGFGALNSQEYIDYASGWGEILRWNFGEILEGRGEPKASKYHLTCGNVSQKWSGVCGALVSFLRLCAGLRRPGVGSGGKTVFSDVVGLWK